MPRKGTKLTPEQIEKRRAADRLRYAKDPERYKAKAKLQHAARKDDPTYKAQANARASAWYEEHKNDPEFKKLHAQRATDWRARNPERYRAWRKDYRAERRKDPEIAAVLRAQAAISRGHRSVVVNAIVAEGKAPGCGCGEKELVCLDLHHVDPTTKSFSIGKTRYQKLSRPDEIRSEVAKCIPMCANCHRKQQSLLRPRQAGFYGRARIVQEAKRAGCAHCGEPERVCLGFHHLDPATKLFKLSNCHKKGITQEMVREEIAKCVLLCENCHRKVHAGLLTLPSAAGSST